jgi:diguanylate cyclase (GGDEF)-like protein
MEIGSLFDLECKIKLLDYAFQPIVNIHTGLTYGYEALLRNVQAAGFDSLSAVFDEMHSRQMLRIGNDLLFLKALQKFKQIVNASQAKLFFNLDNRLFEDEAYSGQKFGKEIETLGFDPNNFCFEISERHELRDWKRTLELLRSHRSMGVKIALDDCGTGFSGLKLLYLTQPDYIKIDRFFIEGIEKDSVKRLLAASIVNIAHLMGSVVIAEGVETEKEYYSCLNIGCDLVQGFLVQHPEINTDKCLAAYGNIKRLSEMDRRSKSVGDSKLLRSEVLHIPAVQSDNGLLELFDRLKDSYENSIVPVVNQHNQPLGIIREVDVKKFAYSKYGRYLLQNRTIKKPITDFMCKFPVADIHTPVEKLLETYAIKNDIEGLIIVDKMQYVGFLRAQSLLRILNEKRVMDAREQNPLSKLPGNTMIFEYVSKALLDTSSSYQLVYFDFDHFKAYNDTYGFRHGDRVILLFAGMLQAYAQSPERFAGHIGGDDFFLGIRNAALSQVQADVKDIAARFNQNVVSFYDAKDIERGFIMAFGRDHKESRFPFITVSSVILELPASEYRTQMPDEITRLIAGLKNDAKNSASKIRTETLHPFMLNPN